MEPHTISTAAETGSKLLEGLTKVSGIIFNRETPKKLALQSFIHNVENSDLQPLEKAAIISNSNRIIKEYCNQYNVVEIALQKLSPTAKPEEVEEDWLASFMNDIRTVSDEEFQTMWAMILAEECENPGSISRQLLTILSQMGRKEAEVFSKLCRFCVQIGDSEDKVPVIPLFLIDDYIPRFGITYDDLISLQTLGLVLVKDDTLIQTHALRLDPGSKVHYGDAEYIQPEGEKVLHIGSVLLTNCGVQLTRIVDAEPVDSYFERVIYPFFESGRKAKGVSIERISKTIRQGLGLPEECI